MTSVKYMDCVGTGYTSHDKKDLSARLSLKNYFKINQATNPLP